MKGIIGAVCGDIIGSTREFHPVKVKDFELIQTNSRFTDDTVLTLAVASWLVKDLSHKHRTLVSEIKHLCKMYPRAGYGGRFTAWINSSDYHPYNSWGNGSAMRVSPVAWAGNSLEEVERLAKISSEVTHNNPEGIRGAIAVAGATYLARTGEKKDAIRDYVEERCFYDLSRSLDSIRPDYRFEVSCQRSVPEAIICFLEGYSYEDTVRNAVSLGADADTQAAISGSIASAYYEVPSEIYTPCMQQLDNTLLNIFTQFNEKYLYE